MSLSNHSFYVRFTYFGDTQQLRVLDFFIDNHFFDYPITEIARESNVSYNSLVVFFPEWIKKKIIIKTRRMGKSDYYTLNLHNSFVKNMIKLDWSLTKNDGRGKKLDRSRVNHVLEDITEVRNPRRTEWLDARFSKQGKQWQITYHKVRPDGTLRETTEPLEACLMKDKTPGISLEYWLDNATAQGLPPVNTTKGDLHFWHPRDKTVAWFGADSGRAGLDCGRDPRAAYSALGVRAARIKN